MSGYDTKVLKPKNPSESPSPAAIKTVLKKRKEGK